MSPTIVLADADADSRGALVHILRSSGYTVQEAARGDEVFRLAAALPACVVVDRTLPDSDGFEVGRWLQTNPATAAIPILYLLDDAAPVPAGDVPYLTRPITAAALLTTVRTLLRLAQATEKLRAGEVRFRATIESVPDAMLIIDHQGAIVLINSQTEKLFGYPRAELIGQPVERLIPERLRARHVGHRAAFLGSPHVRPMGAGLDLSGRHKDGREIPVEVSLSPLQTPEGLRVTATIRDISARKQAEAQLRKMEARYRTLVENIPAVTFMAALEEGITELYVSPQIERLLGFSQQEWLENPILWHTQLHPEDRERWHIEFAQTCAAGQSFRSVYRFLSRTGATVWVQGEAQVFRDEAGQPLFLQGLAFDITDRKMAEEALRASEERYRQVFEHDLTGDFVAAADGTLLACNPAFARIFGFASVAEALRGNFFSLHPHQGTGPTLLERLRREQRLIAQPLELRRLDGRPVHAIANLVGTFDARGALVQITGYLFDDTDRMKLEEQYRQAQKMEAVGQLAGGVAHDFNNLLTVINGYSDLLLLMSDLDSSARQLAEGIRKAGDRAEALTRQLLTFSRKQVVRPRALNLNAVITDLEKILHRVLGEDVELLTQLEPALGNIWADAGQMGQVLMNLAINARDAMPQGGRLTIGTRAVVYTGAGERPPAGAGAGAHVLLTVADTGCGMDTATQMRIFEPFFTTKEPGKGTGLGLATVYGIVQEAGGVIHVASEPGCGSTFSLYLPVTTGEPVLERPRPRSDKPRGSETILVAEDQEDVRQFAAEILRANGYTVLEAADGEEAVRVAAECWGTIHLLMTDVIMPRKSGRELSEQLTAARPGLRVLYVSGYTEDTVIRHGLVKEAIAFLQKPFTRDDLLDRVRATLSGG